MLNIYLVRNNKKKTQSINPMTVRIFTVFSAPRYPPQDPGP